MMETAGVSPDMEQRLAVEISRRNRDQSIRLQKEQQVIRESADLKLFREKIQQSYVNKELASQMAERQTRKLQSLNDEAEMDIYLLKQRQRELDEEQAKRDSLISLKIRQKEMILGQIEARRARVREAVAEGAREKEMIDSMVQKIKREDLQRMEEIKRKKNEAYQTMLTGMQNKQRKLEEERDRDRREEQAYLDHMKKVQLREYQYSQQKAGLEEAKDRIYQTMKNAQLKKQEEDLLMDNLRADLYYEQLEEKARMRDQEERDKQAKQKDIMKAAEVADRKARELKRQQEAEMEEKFKVEMMNRFAYEDKLAQMNLQKRRVKEFEHKQAVERMWKDRLALYRAEKEAQLALDKQNTDDQRDRDDIVQREKERLLREHLPYIDGFMPPNIPVSDVDPRVLANSQQFTRIRQGIPVASMPRHIYSSNEF